MFEAKHLVLFTGAGISTESGLPDFRGPDGIWTRRARGLSSPLRDFSAAQPNAGHRAIVELQELGKLAFLISRNVGQPPSEIRESPGFTSRATWQRD
jgi:mono-ADP-ribosyltransferase sirtuin 6